LSKLDTSTTVLDGSIIDTGRVAKGCNNMRLAIHVIGTCEALEMGGRNGIDPNRDHAGELGTQLVAGGLQPVSRSDAARRRAMSTGRGLWWI